VNTLITISLEDHKYHFHGNTNVKMSSSEYM